MGICLRCVVKSKPQEKKEEDNCIIDMAIMHENIFKFTGYAIEDLSFKEVVVEADDVSIVSERAEPENGFNGCFYVEDVGNYNVSSMKEEVSVDDIVNYVVDSLDGELKRFDLLLGEYSGIFNDALNGSHESDEHATYKINDRGLTGSKYYPVQMNVVREGEKVKVLLDEEYIKSKFYDFEENDFDFF